jgi:hypothetical protein
LGHQLPRRALIAASALPPKAAATDAKRRVRYGVMVMPVAIRKSPRIAVATGA